MKAAVLKEFKHIEWMDVPMPSYGDDDVLVKVSFTSICGSDQHVFNGEFGPRVKVPTIQGHEFVGTVSAVGRSVTRFSIGDRVAVDPIIWCGKCPACEIGHYPACTSLKLIGIDINGAFAEYVAAKEHMTYHIPDGVSDRDSALCEPYSIGFHATHRAAVKPGDVIAYFGAGKIGQHIMQASRTVTQNTAFMVDVLDERLAITKKAYPDIVTINARRDDPVKVIKDMTNGRGVDIAFEMTGEAYELEGRVHPVREAVRSIRGAGKVCVLSLGDQEVKLVMKELIWKEGLLVTSRVCHGEFKDALEYLAKGVLHPEVLVSKIMHMSQAQRAFEMLEEAPDKFLKVLLTFDETAVF